MTITMSIKCTLNDFDAFMQAYHATQDMHAQMGIQASRMYRDLDNPNIVTVHHQFADLEAAQSTAAQWSSADAKAVWEEAGFARTETMEITLLQPVV